MGDDIVDIPLMKRVGVSIAVADAHEVVIKTADMVTAAKGGAGAVREVCAKGPRGLRHSRKVWR